MSPRTFLALSRIFRTFGEIVAVSADVFTRACEAVAEHTRIAADRIRESLSAEVQKAE